MAQGKCWKRAAKGVPWGAKNAKVEKSEPEFSIHAHTTTRPAGARNEQPKRASVGCERERGSERTLFQAPLSEGSGLRDLHVVEPELLHNPLEIVEIREFQRDFALALTHIDTHGCLELGRQLRRQGDNARVI